MSPEALELALLYEVTSLHWPGSEEDLFDEVVEKAVRLFGAQKVALFLYCRETFKSGCYTWGFGRGAHHFSGEHLEGLAAGGNVYVKNLGSPPLGVLYFERRRDFNSHEQRLLDVFAGRLANILQLRHWEETSERLARHLRLVVESTTMIGFFSFDVQGNVLHCNRGARQVFGWEGLPAGGKWMEQIEPRGEFTRAVREVVARAQVADPGEWQVKSLDNALRWVLLTLIPLRREDRVAEVLAVLVDITAQKQVEEELKRQSIFDSLTGLYNRNYFERRLSIWQQDGTWPVVLLVCDVDELKLVNDCLGHSQGDELLKRVAAMLRQVFPQEEIFRVGGDEFVVLLPDRDEKGAQEAYARLMAAQEEFNRENSPVPVNISVGVGVARGPHEDLHEVYKRADDEMYEDKLRRCLDGRAALARTLLAALLEKNPLLKERARQGKQFTWRLVRATGLSPEEVERIINGSFKTRP
ncbi:sensor domain-containing diguanylate cyclase [Desulfovirgula thermocuniculi]|uniref:sensor domain-containing diguanylate cyclase n=1 Tax=Desulfovirgula thermocuniculi TaxID=348842 RepID=UPI000402FA9B|nr:sensor domain-containing diguanylate cyclase [Desulfovirgula thermocuniculi]